MQLLKETVTKMRTNQRFVVLEGLCNSSKLANEDDKLSLRLMDEFFKIEGVLGEIKGIIGLQYEKESEFIQDDEFEQFPEEPVQEVKPVKAEGEEEEEQPPAEEEGEEKKAPKFRKEDYKWTISNGRPKNLP